MKRVGNLYPLITDPENIRVAIHNASKGKRHQRRVKRVLDNADHYAARLSRTLREEGFTPSPYVVRTITDGTSGKTRIISKPAFYPDQVTHWALMQQLAPIIMRGMYEHNCGSVPGRGTSHGQRTLRRWLDNDPRRTKYCLKLDVKQFYPSVNGDILKRLFRRKLKDPRTLGLIDTIIDSADGLPIGNYTSQWFANFFLEGLDHFIKQELGIPYYLRYVDDLVLLGPNKRKLHRARESIEAYLHSLGLEMKGNWQVFRVDKRDIDFLGFRFFRHKTILRKRNALRIRRRLRKVGKKSTLTPKDAAAVLSYWGWLKRSDSYTFYRQHVKPHATISKARKVVSQDAKARNHRERDAGHHAPQPPRQ